MLVLLHGSPDPIRPYNVGRPLYVLICSNYARVRGYYATQLGELRRLSAKSKLRELRELAPLVKYTISDSRPMSPLNGFRIGIPISPTYQLFRG